MNGFEKTTKDASELSDRSLDRLKSFSALVQKWNPSINIIAKSTTDDLWTRHILDSIQIFQCARPNHRLWFDMGSGGGFPGLVVAILAADTFPDLHVVLAESDKRKAVFLTQAARQLDLSVTVRAARIEEIPPCAADVVSARALAPLPTLCSLAVRHLGPGGLCAFLKGTNAGSEVEEARKLWSFDLESVESTTDARSSILVLKGLSHV